MPAAPAPTLDLPAPRIGAARPIARPALIARLTATLMAGLAMTGCAWLMPMRDPPPATEAQVAREIDLLRGQITSAGCARALWRAPAGAEPPPQGEDSYTLTFGSPPMMMDALRYTVVVRKSDRMAYLLRSGGIAGVHEWAGPVSLLRCLQPAFEPAPSDS